MLGLSMTMAIPKFAKGGTAPPAGPSLNFSSAGNSMYVPLMPGQIIRGDFAIQSVFDLTPPKLKMLEDALYGID